MNSSWTIRFLILSVLRNYSVSSMRLWEQVDEWYYLRTAQNGECVCLFLVQRLTPVVRLCTSFFRRRSHGRGFSQCEASLGATVSKACGRREFS